MDDYLLGRLVRCDSVAAREDQIRQLLHEELREYCDEVIYDHLGSIAFHKKGKGPKLMLCAHMDEVGFLVQHISDAGILELIALGSIQPCSNFMQKVHVVTEQKQIYDGVLMCDELVDHKVQNPYVDMGVSTSAEINEMGIQIGDMVSFASEPFRMKDTYVSKALDDRIGCYVLVQALKEVYPCELSCDLFICFTSSEEVGTRGVQTLGYKINPDFAIAVDIGSTKQVHKNTYENHRQLGNGPMLLHYDAGHIPTQAITGYIKRLANKNKINLQQDMFVHGGTDMDRMHLHQEGKPCVTIGIPLHYAHGAYSIVHTFDVDESLRLCVALIQDLHQEVYQKMITFHG